MKWVIPNRFDLLFLACVLPCFLITGGYFHFAWMIEGGIPVIPLSRPELVLVAVFGIASSLISGFFVSRFDR